MRVWKRWNANFGQLRAENGYILTVECNFFLHSTVRMPPQTSQNDTKWWYTRAKWVTRLNQICIQKKTRAKNTKWWYTRTKWSLQVVYRRVNMLESKAHEMMIYTHKIRFTNGWPGQHVGEQNARNDDIHAQKRVYKWTWQKSMPGCAHLPNELPYIYILYLVRMNI